MSISEMAQKRLMKKHPVRNAVAEDWDDIKKSIDEGIPVETIYWILKESGKFVGSGPSSFRGAVKYLMKNPPQSATASVTRVDDTHESAGRQQFVDNRHKPDWN